MADVIVMLIVQEVFKNIGNICFNKLLKLDQFIKAINIYNNQTLIKVCLISETKASISYKFTIIGQSGAQIFPGWPRKTKLSLDARIYFSLPGIQLNLEQKPYSYRYFYQFYTQFS